VRFELADLEEVKAESLDLSKYAVECRPVQQPGEHSVPAMLPRLQRREGSQDRGAEVAVYPDRVPGACWLHEAMVSGRQVNPHHRDQVTAAVWLAG
jgi:hypothetical protein